MESILMHTSPTYPAGGTTVVMPNAITSGAQLTTGSNDSITIMWSDLCNALTGDSTCQTGTINYQNIYIALDSYNPPTFAQGTTQPIMVHILAGANDGSANGNDIMSGCFDRQSNTMAPGYGICNFYVHARDKKVSIENVSPTTTCNENYNAVRMYYQPDDGKNTFMNATYGSSNYADFALDSGCNPVGEWSINNLQNSVGYFFRISMVDVAGNNLFLLSATDGTTGIMDQGSGTHMPKHKQIHRRSRRHMRPICNPWSLISKQITKDAHEKNQFAFYRNGFLCCFFGNDSHSKTTS